MGKPLTGPKFFSGITMEIKINNGISKKSDFLIFISAVYLLGMLQSHLGPLSFQFMSLNPKILHKERTNNL